METLQNPIEELPPYLLLAVGLSLLLHVLFGVVVVRYSLPNNSPDPSSVFSVDFISTAPSQPEPAAVRESRQIVSPPENSAQPPKDFNPRFESDRDSFTEKEQIRRGDSQDSGPTVGTQAGQSAPAPQKAMKARAEAQASRESPAEKPRLKYLTLDNTTLREKFGEFSEPSTQEKAQAAVSGSSVQADTVGNLNSYRPFSRPLGSGARFLGKQGSNDYLPHLPDGDITLLNAKANQFAVFVRRVATQVFSQMRTSGWDVLRAPDIKRIDKDCTVFATLSPQGKLLDVSLEDSSGSSRFDQVLRDAVQEGAQDPNPPQAATADDGNIHFIFKAKSWVQFGGDPRTGAPREWRWLVLATGLD